MILFQNILKGAMSADKTNDEWSDKKINKICTMLRAVLTSNFISTNNSSSNQRSGTKLIFDLFLVNFTGRDNAWPVVISVGLPLGNLSVFGLTTIIQRDE